jgi:hypothetical protein
MGEDYELLAALSPEDAAASGFFVVGHCDGAPEAGVHPEDLSGWDSFRYVE